MVKALFILKIFTFLSGLFNCVRKRLDKKGNVNFKIYDVTTAQKIIKGHLFPNISRTKDNQAMKFGQLIEYKVNNIFHLKSCNESGRETSSRSLFFIKALSKIKASAQHFYFNIFWWTSIWT